MFRPVSADLDFVALEEAELARWRANDVFARSMELREGAEPWVFYEGPPTANGKPGLHHVWARVYKDLFCRYQTMQGRFVARRAGWDTHGLPVEVQVEKQLGISGKKAIVEEVGIEEFTRLCRESVLTFVGEFERLTERIGYWTDMEHAYYTFHREYVESVWWHLQQLFEHGLLYEDLKVIPYCPRCGTALSSHELGQPEVYTDEVDESAYVRFAITDAGDHEIAGATHLAVWTTTPWTLLSNVAVAVNPEITYAVVDGTIVAAGLVASVFGDGVTPSATFPGSALAGVHYQRPFTDAKLPDGVDACYVVLADYVTIEEGTGLVHQAPAFGEIDRQVARDHGLPTLNPVGPDGKFTAEIPWLEGQDVREANHVINDELERRGTLIRRQDYNHSLPHCWRCGTVLIYWGKPSWYVATSKFREKLLAENATIDWHPEHIRDGRFGNWLDNNVDWALSRDRFWGTPLPIWRCPDDHFTCVGSLAELSALAGRDLGDLDPHRPGIDEVVVPCRTCAKEARRVEPVIDAWFDAGSMPAAQVGYPHVEGSAEAMQFPAQLIVEAIDQTRGWFYTLLAVNTLVFGATPYQHVLCLGHIVDENGKKMSKSVGNVIDPWEVLDTRGADPLRWWMFSQGSPWTSTRTSLGAIDASLRETLATLWNTFSFFTLYASINEFDPTDAEIPAPENRAAIDQWILSRLESVTVEVTTALRRLRAARRDQRAQRTHRRRVELVRAAHAPTLLAHRSQRAALGHARRPGDVARRPATGDVAPRAVLSVRRRASVLRTVRRRRDRLGPPDRLATRRAGTSRRRIGGVDGRRATSHVARSRRARRGRCEGSSTARARARLLADAVAGAAGRRGRGRTQRRSPGVRDGPGERVLLRTRAELSHRGSATGRSREGVEARAGGTRFGRRGRDARIGWLAQPHAVLGHVRVERRGHRTARQG